MSSILVQTSDGLVQALKAAAAGDVILLAPGVYTNFSVNGLKFDTAVTITSSNPSSLAVLKGFVFRDVRGIQLDKLELVASSATGSGNPFQILSSSAVELSNLKVYGASDAASREELGGIMIRWSSDVIVKSSEFYNLRFGVTILDNVGINIFGNYFHDIRTDGVRGGGTSNLNISNNSFSDFYPLLEDHPDAIQLWTTNATESAYNIVISNNLITRGGGSKIQGIFLRDQGDVLPYKNVSIVGNVVVGSLYHGITVDGGERVYIDHNTVTGYGAEKSWIRFENVKGGSLADNEAQLYTLVNSTDVIEQGNELIPSMSSLQAGLLDAWLKANLGSAAAPAVVGLPFSGPAGASDFWMQGGASNDVLKSMTLGDAWLEGGGGDDRIEGGAGADHLRGDDGNDYILGGGGFDDILGNAGNDTAEGGDGDDWVVGGKDQDLLYGGAGNDLVYGNLGDDTCIGGDGADWVRGGQGNDSLSAGEGADYLSGDRGDDVLRGGGGADIFAFSAASGIDLVLDFSVAEKDRVMIEGGTSYTLSQIGSDTIVELVGGARLVLVDSQLSTLPAGWILTA